MKPISARAAAKRTAEAKSAAAAMAAEEAEAKRKADELKRTRTLRDRALYTALIRTAVEGRTELVWNDDQANLLQLGQRGLWVYEQGVFDWLDVMSRLREWHLHCLECIAEKWSEDVVYEIKLSDAKALRKLFGGAEGFSKLQRPFQRLLFNELKKDSSALGALHSSHYQDAFEKLLLLCLQCAWKEAVGDGDIDSELPGWTLRQYDEIYSGSFMSELVSQARRLGSILRSQLIDDGSPISYWDEFDSVNMEHLSNLEFDPIKGRVASESEESLPIFVEVKIIGSGHSMERSFKGGILHPAIARYYSGRDGTIEYHKPFEVKSLKLSWVQIRSNWRPFANIVDERLLNWLGGVEGQRLSRFVFGLIEDAALDGDSMIKLALLKRANFWTLSDNNGKSLASLPPSLLRMLLSSYGYVSQVRSEGTNRHLVVSW